MNKATLGLSSGIAAVVLTLVGVAAFNPPQAADAAAIRGVLAHCPLAEVSLDSGYGVSSKVLRPVCASRVAGAE